MYTDLQATQGRIPDEDPRDHQHTWALNLVFSAEIDDFTEAVIDEISARIGMDPDRFVVNKTTTGGTAVLIGSGGKRVPCVELELEIVGAEQDGYGQVPPTPEEACEKFKENVDAGLWKFDPHLISIDVAETLIRELNTLDENGEPTNPKYNRAPE